MAAPVRSLHDAGDEERRYSVSDKEHAWRRLDDEGSGENDTAAHIADNGHGEQLASARRRRRRRSA